jgi:hypothetical protein
MAVMTGFDGISDFRRRFLTLLSFKFREFGSVTALSVLEAANAGLKFLENSGLKGSPPSLYIMCAIVNSSVYRTHIGRTICLHDTIRSETA